MTITSDRVVIHDMDTQAHVTQWTAVTHAGLSLNDSTSQVPIFREGNGCAEGQVDDVDGRWYNNTSINLTNGRREHFCYVIWMFQTAPGAVSGMTNMQVGFSSANNFGGNGGLWNFKPAFEARDTYGWLPCLVYPTQPDEQIGTFASLNLASIASHGIDINNSAGIQVRLFGIEQSFKISEIIGHSQTVTLANLATHSKDKASDNDIGVLTQQGDSFRTQVIIRLGDTAATANTTFNESAKVIHFDNFNTDHEIGFDFIGDAGADTLNFTLTGCFLFWNDGASAAFVGVAAVDTWSVTGNTFLRAGPVELPAHATGYVTNANTFDACGEVDIGDATFEGNTITNATSGVLYTGTGTRRAKNNTYSNNTDGIHFDTAQTITLDGDQFSGNTDDIHFSGTGTLTINLINGANPTTSRVSGGGTVVINPPAVTTQITVTDNAGADLQNARVMVRADAGGPRPHDVTVTITRSGTVATVSHTAHGFIVGDKFSLKGITDKTEDNKIFTVATVPGANSYTYTTTNSGSTSYTGTILSTAIFIDGLTNVSGVISDTRSFTSSQPVDGFIRKASASPRFKTFNLAGNTINSTTGLTVNVRMVLDE
jgi:hypothetical protein